jgi:PD-(D/E)XK nuclease superfamily
MSAFGRLTHLSFSSLAAAEHCLRLFYETRLSAVRHVEIADRARSVGKLVHAMIEAHLHGRDPLDGGIDVGKGNAPFFDEARYIFARWLARFSIPSDRTLGVERYAKVAVPGVALPLVGYDDFVYEDPVENLIVLRDFKSGWGARVYGDYTFQGDLACLRYQTDYPQHPPERLCSEVEFVRSGRTVRRPWNEEMRLATIARVQRAWVLITTIRETWAETPGNHCRFCPVLFDCASATAARKEQRALVATEDDARSALARLVLFRTASAHLRRSLEAYTEAAGPIRCGDDVGAPKAGHSVRLGKPMIRDAHTALARVGVDAFPPGVLKIDTTLKGAQALLQDERLSDLITIGQPSVRFRLSGVMEDDEEQETAS